MIILHTSVELDDEDVVLSLLPEWEQSFAVTFGEDDFARAVTVGEFIAAAERRIGATKRVDETLSCTGQRVFYRLRRALSETEEVLPAVLSPGVSLREIFPLKKRRQQWQRLREVSGLPLPALLPSWWLFLLLWSLITVGLGMLLSAWGMGVLAGLAGASVICSWSWLQVALPCATLGELTMLMVARQYTMFNGNNVNKTEIRRILLAGLARCSVERETVTAADLGEATQLKWQSG